MQLKDGVDARPFIDALEAMPSKVPSIKSSTVNADLGLTKQYGHNASFAWIAEFEDQAGWEAYIQSQPHDEFYEMYKDQVDQFLVNQWSTA
jgi:hypothetical protein